MIGLQPRLFKKKMRLVRRQMEKEDIDVWIVFTREGNVDPVAEDVGLDSVVWKSAGIFFSDGTNFAVVGNLDAESVRQKAIYDRVFGYGKEGVSSILPQIVSYRSVKRVAVNTSHDFGVADGLSISMKKYLRTMMKSVKFLSAENLIMSLRSKLLPEEMVQMKIAVSKCEEIYRIAEQDFIKFGRTDKQIHELMTAEAKKMDLELAWQEDHCPSVMIGNMESGHLGYSNITLERGKLLHLDFGVKYNGYCSDLQRMYFFGGSTPTSVKKLFEVTKKATLSGIESLKVGVRGHIVDDASRSSVLASGYPEYLHATGHPIARETHEIGPMLGPKWKERYGNSMEKELQPDTVFTIEPSVVGREGTFNLETEVLLTPNGPEILSTFEDDLYEI